MRIRVRKFAVAFWLLMLAVGTGLAYAQSGVVNLVDPHGSTIVVQEGDLFHVTAIQSGNSGKVLVVDLGDGRSGLSAAIGELIPVKYERSGVYTITSKLGNRKLRPVTVEVLGREVPADVEREIPQVALLTESTDVGVGVGSVYAESGRFPMRFAASGACFFQLKRYGYGVVWQGNIPAGDTIIVMNGPNDGDPIWTLIKFIDGVQKGGTHVLSAASPYRLQIEDIKLLEGPLYTPVGENVADVQWPLLVGDTAKLQVVPDPWWAIDPVCASLYNWAGTDLVPTTGLELDVSYLTGGPKDVTLICDSDDSGGELTSIESLNVDLDGQEPNAAGVLVEVDDGIEADAGVLAITEITTLTVRSLGAGLVAGTYTLTWSDPGPNKELQIKPLLGGTPWKGADTGISGTYGSADVVYLIKLKPTQGAVWLDTDTVEVILTHVESGLTDVVKLVPVKVDLDVDADYDGEITSNDDPIEEEPDVIGGPGGGMVAVGARSQIVLKPCLPADWGTTADDQEKYVELTWDNPSKIAVFTTPTVGTGDPVLNGQQYSQAELGVDGKILWVEGLELSDSIRDISMRLTAKPDGVYDAVRLTVYSANVKWIASGEDSEDVDVLVAAADELTGPLAGMAGAPGGVGGFGGPPEGSGFASLVNPFTVRTLTFSDSGDDDQGFMSLSLESNLSDWEKTYVLQETTGSSRIFADAADTLAVRVLNISPDPQGGIASIQAMIVSTVFGARRGILLHRTTVDPDTFESERMSVIVEMQQMPDPSTPDQICLTMKSSLKASETTDVLTETTPDSLLFVNSDSTLSLTINRITAHGVNAIDDMTVYVSSDSLKVAGYVDAIETTADSLVFWTDALSDVGATAGTGAGAGSYALFDIWSPELTVSPVGAWPFPAPAQWGPEEQEIAVRLRRDSSVIPNDYGIPLALRWIKSSATLITDGSGNAVGESWSAELSAGEQAFFLIVAAGEPSNPENVFSWSDSLPFIKVMAVAGDVLIASPRGQAKPVDEIIVATLEKAQYRKAETTDAFADGPGAVNFGSGVDLKAVTAPDFGSLSGVEPIFWLVDSSPSGASIPAGWLLGSGETITIPSSKLDKAGIYEFKAHWLFSSAKITINIIKVDLDIGSVDDDDEESVGGFIPVNADNDNGSTVTDHIPATRDFDTDGYTDDDLIPISLSLEPTTGLSGTLRLRKVEGGRDRIKVWESTGKATEVTLPKTWTVGTDTIPATLQVEGLKEGEALREVDLVLEYLDGGAVICDDTVKATVTPVLEQLQAVDNGYTPEYIEAYAAILSNGGWGQTMQLKGQVSSEGYPSDGALRLIQHIKPSNLLPNGVCWITAEPRRAKFDFNPPYNGMELVDQDDVTPFTPFYCDVGTDVTKFHTYDTPQMGIAPLMVPDPGEQTQIDLKLNLSINGVWHFSSDDTVYFLGNASWSTRFQGDLVNTGGTVTFSKGSANDNVGSTGFTRDNANKRTSGPASFPVSGYFELPY